MKDYTLQKKGADCIVIRTEIPEEVLLNFLDYDVEVIKSMEVE